MMVETLFFKFAWLKFKSTKNNYDFDKMTVVEIQGGSSNYGNLLFLKLKITGNLNINNMVLFGGLVYVVKK